MPLATQEAATIPKPVIEKSATDEPVPQELQITAIPSSPILPLPSTPEEPASMAPSDQAAGPPIEIALTEGSGIGEKRANQLETLGVINVGDLAQVQVNDLAEKLKISPKIVAKRVAS